MFNTKQECADFITEAFEKHIANNENDFEKFGVKMAIIAGELTGLLKRV